MAAHDHREHPMDDEDPCGPPGDVPEGAAVFPLIPKELGVHPLLLAVIHAVVFLDGSSEDVLNDAAANEALNYLATYLQRLDGGELKRIREDMTCLVDFGKQEKWPAEELAFLKGFLDDFGVKAADRN